MAGSIVQIVGPGGASTAASSIVSSSITCTAGNQLWVIAISDDATITSISDSWSSGANSYTERGSVIEAAILRRLHHATCQITTGGTGTVTVNLGASVANRQVWLVEVTGVGAYDAQGTATDTGNNPTTSASATNSAQPAFCVAAIVDYQGGTPAVGQISGTAATSGGTLAAGGQLGGLVEYRSVTTVTAQTANFTNAGFNRTCTVFAVFLEDSPPSISAQPTDQTANDGATATFSVTATGGTAPYTYQWQDNSSGSFANIGGATSSSYSPTASFAIQGRQYRCVVTGANSLSVTSNAATLRVAFNTSGTGPRAFPNLGAPFAAGSVESLVRGQAAAGGGATVTGQSLTSAASLIPGAAQASSSVSGQTLTSTASLIPGAASASVSVAGQTLTATASLIPGSAQAGSSVAGQTLTATASIINGSVTADSQVSGQTVTSTASLIPGSASAGASATVNGQTLTSAASLIPGAAQADSQVSGQTLTSIASFLAGTATADANVPAQILVSTASLLPGSASGVASATVNGQILSVTASLIAGSASSGGAGAIASVRRRGYSPRKVLPLN